MNLPAPMPGLVIRYAFLWGHEAESGASEGRKDRPCAIVVATRRTPAAELRVIVAPITHVLPQKTDASVEIPPDVRRTLGLDDEPQWIRADELNAFVWPGYDLRPIPGRGGAFVYGLLPQDLFEQLRQAVLACRRTGRISNRD